MLKILGVISIGLSTLGLSYLGYGSEIFMEIQENILLAQILEAETISNLISKAKEQLEQQILDQKILNQQILDQKILLEKAKSLPVKDFLINNIELIICLVVIGGLCWYFFSDYFPFGGFSDYFLGNPFLKEGSYIVPGSLRDVFDALKQAGDMTFLDITVTLENGTHECIGDITESILKKMSLIEYNNWLKAWESTRALVIFK